MHERQVDIRLRKSERRGDATGHDSGGRGLRLWDSRQERKTATRFSPDHRFKLRSEMRADLYAIQLSRQVARNFHTGLRLLNRRLAPLTHSELSFAS